MELKLESPYKERWKFGYLRTRKSDGRQIVDLFNSDSDRTSTSYARYLAAVAQGKLLEPDQHADHKDDDRTNDASSNIQILSAKANILKSTEYGREYVILKCCLCKKEFKRELRQVKKTLLVYCSVRCRDLMK